MTKAKQVIRILVADDHAIFRDGLRKLLEAADEIQIVGEASNGVECVKMLGKLKPDILLLDLRMPEKDGLGRAYAAGMAEAVAEGAEYVLQMDSDGSHPAATALQMLGVALSTGCGMVVGSRYVSGGSLGEGWPIRRRMLSAWANWYTATVLGLPLRDITSGFTLWRADVLRETVLGRTASAGYSFQVEAKTLALRAGHAAIEVPIRFEQRRAGASKMNLAVQAESALVPWQLRLRRPS